MTSLTLPTPLAQTPWGLTGRTWLQAGAQWMVIRVLPPLNSLGIDSRNELQWLQSIKLMVAQTVGDQKWGWASWIYLCASKIHVDTCTDTKAATLWIAISFSGLLTLSGEKWINTTFARMHIQSPFAGTWVFSADTSVVLHQLYVECQHCAVWGWSHLVPPLRAAVTRVATPVANIYSMLASCLMR